MAAAYYSSKDVLQRVRDSISETAAFGQSTISTNLSLDRGYIWLIHQVLYWLSGTWDDPAAGAVEYFHWQLTRESKAAGITTLNEPDLIDMHRMAWTRAATIGTDAGPMYLERIFPIIHTFPIPLPFAGNTLYFAHANTLSGAIVASVEVRFTLQKVREKDYFAVASSLLLT